jgi:hypothetical protein
MNAVGSTGISEAEQTLRLGIWRDIYLSGRSGTAEECAHEAIKTIEIIREGDLALRASTSDKASANTLRS